MIRAFLVAVQFLTRLPLRFSVAPDGPTVGRSLLFYPLVGLFLGLLLAACAWILRAAPASLAAALLLVLWVAASGALHLDGLADTVDAWAGGQRDRERTLELMRDPHIGAMGVVAVVLVLLLKFGALLALCTELHAAQQAVDEIGNGMDAALSLLPLFFAPWLARTLLLLLFLTVPYVRPGGLGATLVAHLPRTAIFISVLVSFAAAASLAFFSATTAMTVAALFMATIFFLYWSVTIRHRIGGTTGDTAGALVELSETAVFIIAVLV